MSINRSLWQVRIDAVRHTILSDPRHFLEHGITIPGFSHVLVVGIFKNGLDVCVAVNDDGSPILQFVTYQQVAFGLSSK